MHVIKRLLVGLDLHVGDRLAATEISADTQLLLDQATLAAQRYGATLTLCSVLNLSPQTVDLLASDHGHVKQTVEDIAQQALDRCRSQIAAQGVTVDTLLKVGDPATELLHATESGGFDLIMMGTRHRSRAARILFGSTARHVMHQSKVPVWVVKPEEVREIREILVASDLDPGSLSVVHAAVSLARAIAAKLYVVHTLEFPFEVYLRTAGVTETEVEAYRQRMHQAALADLTKQLQQTDYRTLPHGVKVDIVEGPPDVSIPKYIEQHEVDLLVLGTHSHQGLSGFLLGNTAERLLPSVHCSLLTIPPRG